MSDHQHVVFTEAVDPVCGMKISPTDAVGHVDHRGETYYFCSQSCLDRFRANPAAFVADRHRQTTSTPAGVTVGEYTCPMHPDVRQHRPGSCPKCGMALEPAIASAV